MSTKTTTNAALSSSLTEEEQQATAFDKTTEKGQPDGLFQACMTSIRQSHATANRARSGLVVAGLFTDKKIYREVISMFYLATNEMEQKLLQLKDKDEICSKLLSLQYRFAPQYEQDLQVLYSKDTWEKDVQLLLEQQATDGAKAYIQKIRDMTSGAELAGPAFCLWGALIIGGGAVAMPRVQALCGPEATHIFQDVTGPGRERRKQQFVQLWDNLVSTEETDAHQFDTIVQNCQDCMEGNNELIVSVKRHPWWLKYLISSVVGVAAVGVYYLQHRVRQ